MLIVFSVLMLLWFCLRRIPIVYINTRLFIDGIVFGICLKIIWVRGGRNYVVAVEVGW